MSDDVQTINVYQGLPGTQGYGDYTGSPCTLDIKTKGPWADVRAYPWNVTGSGSDETTTIQACVTANPGKRIKFPLPTSYYYVTNTITSPTTGKGVVLDFSGANTFSSSAIVQIDDTFTAGAPIFALLSAATVRGLTVYHRGATKYSGKGIRIGDSTSGSPQNIYVADSNFYKLDTAIHYGGRSYYNEVRNVTAYQCNNGAVFDMNAGSSLGSVTFYGFRAWRCSTVTLTASITSGSKVVTPTSLTHVTVGNTVVGTGIPYGAVIDSINTGAGTFTMNLAATATDVDALLYTLQNGVYGKGIWAKSSVAATGNQIEFVNGIFEQNPYHVYSEGGTISLIKCYLGDGSITPIYVNGGTVLVDGHNTEKIQGGGSTDYLPYNVSVPTYGVHAVAGAVHLKDLTLYHNVHGVDGRATLTHFRTTASITASSTTVTPVVTTNIVALQTVTGTGIPTGTTVVSVDHDAGTFVISQAATETNAAVVLEFTKSSSSTRFYGSDVYSEGGKIYSDNVIYTGEYMPRFTSSDNNYCEEIPNYIVNGTFSRLDGAAIDAQSGFLNDITIRSNVTLTNRGDNGIGGNVIRITAAGAAEAYFDIPYYAPHLVGKIARISAFIGSRNYNGAVDNSADRAVLCPSSEFTVASTTTYGSYGMTTVTGQEMRSGSGAIGFFLRFDYPVLINKPMGYIRFRAFNTAAAGSWVDLAGLVLTDQEHAGKLARYKNCERIYAASTPTAGTYVAYEEVYNATPDSGDYEKWFCTIAGSPGTWKGGGLIA